MPTQNNSAPTNLQANIALRYDEANGGDRLLQSPSIETALDNTRVVAYRFGFFRITRSVTAALFLSQLWWETKNSDGEWVSKSEKELESETGLTRYQQETAARRLQELKVIEVKRHATRYLRIDRARLLTLLNRRRVSNVVELRKTSISKCGKPAIRNAGFQHFKPGHLFCKDPRKRSKRSDLSTYGASSDSPKVASNASVDKARFKPPKPEREPLKPEDLVEVWNEVAARSGGLLAQVKVLAGSRRRKCLRRLAEHPADDFWNRVFGHLERSAFLRGMQDRADSNPHKNWRASFDWLVNNDSNCVRVYEGNYNR